MCSLHHSASSVVGHEPRKILDTVSRASGCSGVEVELVGVMMGVGVRVCVVDCCDIDGDVLRLSLNLHPRCAAVDRDCVVAAIERDCVVFGCSVEQTVLKCDLPVGSMCSNEDQQ